MNWMFDKSTSFKQVCQLLSSLIVALVSLISGPLKTVVEDWGDLTLNPLSLNSDQH